jgi:hypothetical protein
MLVCLDLFPSPLIDLFLLHRHIWCHFSSFSSLLHSIAIFPSYVARQDKYSECPTPAFEIFPFLRFELFQVNLNLGPTEGRVNVWGSKMWMLPENGKYNVSGVGLDVTMGCRLYCMSWRIPGVVCFGSHFRREWENYFPL